MLALSSLSFDTLSFDTLSFDTFSKALVLAHIFRNEYLIMEKKSLIHFLKLKLY